MSAAEQRNIILREQWTMPYDQAAGDGERAKRVQCAAKRPSQVVPIFDADRPSHRILECADARNAQSISCRVYEKEIIWHAAYHACV